MSVYKPKKSKFYAFDFMHGGLRFTGSTNKTNERDAKEVEKAERGAAERLVAAIRAQKGKPITVATACERWWSEVGTHGKEDDLAGALDWLRDILGPSRYLHDLTNDDLARAVTERRKCVVKAGRDENGHQRYRPIMPRTVNRTVIILLKRVMRRAREAWDVVIHREPNWKTHMLAEVKRPVREITIEEEERIEAVERDDYRPLRQFAMITGLRLRETLLTWPQVDFDLGVIRVITKGDKPRILPLSKEAYTLLWNERGRHPTHVWTFIAKRTRKEPRSGRFYVRGTRYPITASGLTSTRVRTFAKADVKARFHDLRHTTGMRTLRATGNLKTVQKLLGHSDVSTTARFYADANLDDLREAMQRTSGDMDSRRKSRTTQIESDKAMKSRENPT